MMEELITRIRQNGKDTLWVDRAIGLIECLAGTGIDPLDPALLDAMIAHKDKFPQIERWLVGLPGLAAGDRATAEQQLGFLTMQFAVKEP